MYYNVTQNTQFVIIVWDKAGFATTEISFHTSGVVRYKDDVLQLPDILVQTQYHLRYGPYN